MELMKVAGEIRGEDAREDHQWTKRRPGRSRMFKPAQIAFNGSVLDCVLLDVSPHGAQLHLMAPADVPSLVTLRLPDGESRSMRRCWQRGSHIGFEVVGTEPLKLRADGGTGH
jgi:hypothetical protein